MAVAVTDLKAYVGAGDEHTAVLASSLQVAAELISKYVGGAAVPDNVLDRCTLMVAADLFERRNAPNGIVNQQYQSFDGVGQAPARIARDPLAGVYALLGRYVLPW